jgi:diaminopimelate decarboxylase
VTHHFSYQNDTLCVEGLPLTDIADQYGTPLYVYSRAALTDHYLAYARACEAHQYPDAPAQICYSVKSSATLAILHLLSRLGAGFDIVSGGELARVMAAGADPQKVVYSGVGKTANEIRYALSQDILCFNVESLAELHRINRIAGDMGQVARIAFRVNPDVDPHTHPYISTGLRENKFGIPHEEALSCYRIARDLPHVQIIGIDCHIGSQLLDDAPLVAALHRLIFLCDQLEAEGISLRHLDLGGGLGIAYRDEKTISVGEHIARIYDIVRRWRQTRHQGKPIRLIWEPGRSVSGNAGILLTEIQYEKSNAATRYLIVDAAMNDLLRPAMYEAWHDVLPLVRRVGNPQTYDIVGPICESGDWLAKNRALTVREGDRLAILSAGAYGMSMASHYNTRGKAAEVMVDNGRAHLIRPRETAEDLFATERIVP